MFNSNAEIVEGMERNRREGVELIRLSRPHCGCGSVTDTWTFLQAAKRFERKTKKAKAKRRKSA